MKVVTKKSTIKTIRKDDLDFMLKDGLYCTPRAGFEIELKCPKEYRMIITECISNGWLKPVAYVKEQEYIWEKICS